MSRVNITFEIKGLGQTNGETSHVRSKCETKAERRAKSPDRDTKMEETVLLQAVIQFLIAAEAKERERRKEWIHGDHDEGTQDHRVQPHI